MICHYSYNLISKIQYNLFKIITSTEITNFLDGTEPAREENIQANVLHIALSEHVHYSFTMKMTNNLDKRLGERIRIERESRGWTYSDLANCSGVSRAMLHKIERGESSPTAALLGKLSGAFRLSMSTLIARAEMQKGRLSRFEDQQVWVDPETGYVRRQISPASELPMDVIEVTLPAGAKIHMPSSAYAFLKQLIWVMQGELIFKEGNETHSLHTGDCLELGPPSDCIFENATDLPCVYAVILIKTNGAA